MSNLKNNCYNKPWFKKKQPRINQELARVAVNFDNTEKHGYYGFQSYFPENSKDVEVLLKCVTSFERFIERHSDSYPLETLMLETSFTVNYKILVTGEDQIYNEWNGLEEDLVKDTEFCLNCMGLAMHQTLMKHFLNKTEQGENEAKGAAIRMIKARIVNYEPIVLLSDISVIYYGKLVSLRGTVIKAGHVKIICRRLAFTCGTCTGIQIVNQNDNSVTPPKECLTEDCNAKSHFTPLESSPYCQMSSWQIIKIQELLDDVEYESGRIPRNLECELTEDLVKSCVPGDDIIITGVIKVKSNKTDAQGKKDQAEFSIYLDAISIVNSKDETQKSYGASERITFNTKDYYAIEKIHEEPQLFRFLVQSLCPNIYGLEIVKAGLLLSLFGGTKSDRSRAQSHVLMVGDPGLGKSQMLKACTNVAPRGVYVCSNTSTSSGLTVTVTREPGGEYALEAGALMLADEGCCCIDEFDKMPSQHACLLEAMEQQSISIAKAGIVCSLPTRATILAAANPVGGHYNKAKTIAENLKIASPMLSRFDLIFILLDQPNEELDMLLTEHVLALHSGKIQNSAINSSFYGGDGQTTLRGRLKCQRGEEIDYLPHSLFRKYIAYAQKYVHPRLSDGAKRLLKDFYPQLRAQFQCGDSAPVTRRQLNSLVRLTQARAKTELREEATEEDALDVIEIMRETLLDIFTDNRGILDTTRSQNGTGMSTKNEVKRLLEVMQKKSEVQGSAIFSTNDIRVLSENIGISKNNFYKILESMNIQGFIIKKGSNEYKFFTAQL